MGGWVGGGYFVDIGFFAHVHRKRMKRSKSDCRRKESEKQSMNEEIRREGGRRANTGGSSPPGVAR